MPSLDDPSYAALRQDLAGLLENERSAKRQGLEQEKAQTYWKVGQRLDQVAPVQKGGTGYGRKILKQLSQDLDIRERRLYEMLQFYRALEILPTSALLGWSHYRALLKVPDSEARTYYLEEAIQAGWSVRRLENQIQDRVFEQQQDPAHSSLTPRRGKPVYSIGVVFGEEITLPAPAVRLLVELLSEWNVAEPVPVIRVGYLAGGFSPEQVTAFTEDPHLGLDPAPVRRR